MGRTSFTKTFLKHTGIFVTSVSIMTAMQASEDQLDRDLKFVNELEDEKLDGFILPFINDRIKENPDESDRYNVAIADIYIKSNKVSEANAIIKKIPKTSKYYNSGTFILGKAALEKGDFKTGVKYFTEYIENVKDKKDKSKSADEEFRSAVSYLSWAYQKLNQPDKSAEILKLLSSDPRETSLMGINAKLDTAENLKQEERTGGKKNNWRVIAQKTIPECEELRWAGADAITLFSLVGSGRAYYLLEDYPNSLKQLSQMPEIFDAYDDEFRKRGQESSAPGAHARFWMGKVFLAMAQKEKDAKEKTKLYIKALKKYLHVALKFTDFPRISDAYADLIYCQAELKKLGKNVALPKDLKKPQIKEQAVSLVTGDANKFFTEKSYDKAIPILLQTAVENRTREGVQDVLYKLGYCYASTNQNMEALAVADYLASAFPDFQKTPLLLLQAGQLSQNAKKIDDAMLAYEIYLDKTPTHQYGADIALKVAKEYYDRAMKAAKDADAFKGDVRNKKIEEAMKLYLDSIPRYDRIINNYGSRPERVEQAYNFKAQAYASAREFEKAAETYVKYCEIVKSKSELAKAKLSIGDFYMKAGSKLNDEAKKLREDAFTFPADSGARKTKIEDADKKEKAAAVSFNMAAKHLKELVESWMTAGGQVGAPSSSADVKKTSQDALLLLASAYDAAKEKKNAIDAFKKFIAQNPSSQKVPPCMARIGLLYYELNDYATSSKILEDLAQKFPDSKEAKNAYYNLGRNMYEIGNYAKCVEVFNKLFAQKIDITPSNLRWIASSLYDCGATHPKGGAQLSITAAKKLLGLIKTADKNLDLWVGDKTALSLNADPKEKAKTISLINQKILFDAGSASFYADDSKAAIMYITDLITLDANSPYLYKGLFVRADAYIKLKDFENARRDLNEISMAAITARKDAIASEAKCKMAQTFMMQKDYTKAFNAYNIMAKSLNVASIDGVGIYPPNLSNEEIEKLKEERKKEMAWIEEAVYQGALCAAKLGQKGNVQELTNLYSKHFPNGTYAKKILSLPPPEGANKN
ncbi:MAG: hypothetical protein A2020_01240 [Lentisphaerae bacterium GWF2_45_14]|nr:MAG: hypothetical protein A2020_01240 [Lentisphaerae bacterium GWF2_45_14]